MSNKEKRIGDLEVGTLFYYNTDEVYLITKQKERTTHYLFLDKEDFHHASFLSMPSDFTLDEEYTIV